MVPDSKDSINADPRQVCPTFPGTPPEDVQRLTDLRHTVYELTESGYAICRIDPGAKQPGYPRWPCRSVPSAEVGTHDGIGILAGPLSNGGHAEHALVIIDLDSPQAVAIADKHLPATGMVEGRAEKPRSHRYYLVPLASVAPEYESVAEQASIAARQYAGHPGPVTISYRDADGAETLRLCGTGAQCVCPPSRHESGEIREWHGGTQGEPSTVDFSELLACVDALAAACGAHRADRTAYTPPKAQSDTGGRTPLTWTVTADDKVLRASAYLATMDGAISGQGGHDTTFRAAVVLAWDFGLEPDVALQLLRAEYNPRCSPPWTEAELKHKVDDALKVRHDRPRGWRLEESRGAATSDTEQTTITLSTDLPAVHAQAAALLANEPDVYVRGGVLTQVIPAPAPKAGDRVHRSAGAPIVRELPLSILGEMLAGHAAWRKWDGRTKAIVPTVPGEGIVRAVMDRGRWYGVPDLVGVSPHPVIRADGSLLASKGYDDQTGLYIHLAHHLLVNVREAPTQADAAAAADDLCDLVKDFPFAGPEHRSAWLAALLTPLAKPAISGPSPLFLFDANAAGSGKTLLAQSIGTILTGSPMATMSYSSDESETRKAITSLAVSGDAMVLLDNLTGRVGGAALDAALTSTRWRDRLLGTNRVFDGELVLTWYATGNNVQLVGDTGRRTLLCRLESMLERPEDRSDYCVKDLLAYVYEHRSRCLAAALTCLRAWFIAGMPRASLTPWGSFDGWSGVVRQAIVFAGLPDPAGTRQYLRIQLDSELDALASVMEVIRSLDHGQGVTVAKLVEEMKPGTAGHLTPNGQLLTDACVTWGIRLGDTRALGNKLKYYARRAVGGQVIARKDEGARRLAAWEVRPATGAAA